MKTLYFILGVVSDDQKKLAQKASAKIRNSAAYHEGDYIEACDAVMGDVPKGYDGVDRHDLDSQAQKLAKPKQAKKETEVDAARAEQINAALELLDHANEEHWTKSGLPDMKALETLMEDKSVTRAEVEVVAPEFKRITDSE